MHHPRPKIARGRRRDHAQRLDLARQGLAFVGQTRSRDGSVGHGWIVVASDKGSARGTEIDATSIDAAISDGNGRALLVGDAGSQAWFGALDARGVVRSSTMRGIDAPIDMVDILPGQDDGERALLLGNASAGGGFVSLDARGSVRWQAEVGDAATQIRAGARVLGEQAELLVVEHSPRRVEWKVLRIDTGYV